jgi:hypothetical protein
MHREDGAYVFILTFRGMSNVVATVASAMDRRRNRVRCIECKDSETSIDD